MQPICLPKAILLHVNTRYFLPVSLRRYVNVSALVSLCFWNARKLFITYSAPVQAFKSKHNRCRQLGGGILFLLLCLLGQFQEFRENVSVNNAPSFLFITFPPANQTLLNHDLRCSTLNCHRFFTEFSMSRLNCAVKQLRTTNRA